MKKRLLGLGLLIASFVANAQTAVTNTGTLYITSNSDIFYAAGDFTNTSTALTNNGQLYVKGTLTNNQTPATIGTGTLHLNGSSAQSVTGAAVFKTYNLNTNNTSGGIAINTNLSVSGTHTFVSGIITTAASKYLVYEDNATNTGAIDAAHVNGWVKKIGDDNFTFPVGSNSQLREISMSGLTSSSEYNVQYSGTTTNTSNLQWPLVTINPNEYWTMEKVSGSGNISVTLNWNNSKVAFPTYVLADLRAAQYTSSKWTSAGAASVTGDVTTSGTITSDPFSLSGAIPLSIGSISFTVPLNFLSIVAQRKPDHTFLEWKTANEENVKQHEIQRSWSNNGFTTIAVQSARNTIEQQTYSYNDFDKLEGTVYYRIKSADLDGKTKYSKVVAVHYNGITETIMVRNNPASEAINLSLSSTKNTIYRYQLISSGGSIVQEGALQYGGTGSMSIPLQSSISGHCILLLNCGGNVSAHKVIVQ